PQEAGPALPHGGRAPRPLTSSRQPRPPPRERRRRSAPHLLHPRCRGRPHRGHRCQTTPAPPGRTRPADARSAPAGRAPARRTHAGRAPGRPRVTARLTPGVPRPRTAPAVRLPRVKHTTLTTAGPGGPGTGRDPEGRPLVTLRPEPSRTEPATLGDAPDEALRRSLGVGRRRFLTTCTAVAAGAVAAPVFGAAPALAHGRDRDHGHGHDHGHGRGQVLVPPHKRGIILYTVRDATARDPLASDLPAGFREVFKQLARHGYRQVEFAGYRQHANAPGGDNLETVEGARLLRRWLDDHGLRAQGNHGFIPPSWPLTPADKD